LVRGCSLADQQRTASRPPAAAAGRQGVDSRPLLLYSTD